MWGMPLRFNTNHHKLTADVLVCGGFGEESMCDKVNVNYIAMQLHVGIFFFVKQHKLCEMIQSVD